MSPVSLNLLGTHFLCLATDVLTLTPSPGLGGLSFAHGLDQSRFPGRLSALSQGLEFRQNFWKARWPPPPVTWEQSLLSYGPALLPGVAPTLDPGPQASSPVVQGAGVPRDCVISELGPPSLPASSRPGVPQNQQHPEMEGWVDGGRRGERSPPTAPTKGHTPTIATVTTDVNVPGNSPR